MQGGWIKLHRKLLDKPIWAESTTEQKTILVTLLMMVNYESNEWEWQGEKYTVKPGQVITSLESIAQASGKGVSVQNVRTALKRFEKYGFLTNKSTNKNRLISIENWGFYQQQDDEANKQINMQLTSNQQATNNYKEIKNLKNEKKKHYADVIFYLNKKSGKDFSPETADTQKFIDDRLSEGRTIEDFKKVIDNKCKQWLGNDNEIYLRPKTLFKGDNFEGYLNEGVRTKSKVINARDKEIAMNQWIADGGDPDKFEY
ncbi:conserved phage C-terminal domain-containing protein [Terribacillus saccharophilus]|uniref:conserved phage C-terminal domain-containing protein n=1 Tax=Terribacillus saccharophilus TaxID=361277 RepID=UPI000C99E04B|nr:conserved phage C-terminal domain-containing protein [Terribacillus goriensis]